MYRVTGDKQYQDWGWAAFQAIEEYAKLANGDGYASVNNVKRIPVTHRDMMESFFLAEVGGRWTEYLRFPILGSENWQKNILDRFFIW